MDRPDKEKLAVVAGTLRVAGPWYGKTAVITTLVPVCTEFGPYRTFPEIPETHDAIMH